MESSKPWKSLFENWPPSLPREGLLVTTSQEAIPFRDYLVSPELLLLERDRPDSQGSRKVIIAYSSIYAVKIAAVRDLADFSEMGFVAAY